MSLTHLLTFCTFFTYSPTYYTSLTHFLTAPPLLPLPSYCTYLTHTTYCTYLTHIPTYKPPSLTYLLTAPPIITYLLTASPLLTYLLTTPPLLTYLLTAPPLLTYPTYNTSHTHLSTYCTSLLTYLLTAPPLLLCSIQLPP
jgi:hypothetical protein